MKHLTVGKKSLLVGDDAADLLIDYAKHLGQQRTADAIDLHAIGADGDEVDVTFLLNEGITITSETSRTGIPEPNNGKAEQYMRSEILRLTERFDFRPEDIAGERIWNVERS